MSDLVPVSDEQAKAVASVAEFGTEAVKATTGAGGWVAAIVQDVPKDLIGVLGGDWLHHKRQRNLATLEANTAAHLEHVSVERRTEPSPSLLVPLLTAAVNESREALQALWAALLANAMLDDGRKVRRAFFRTVEDMEMIDALVFEAIYSAPPDALKNGVRSPRMKEYLASANSPILTGPSVDLSFVTLENLKCLQGLTNTNLDVSLYGQELYRALQVD